VGAAREIIDEAGKSTRAVHDLLVRAGFEVELAPTIQQEIWFKLWGNMTVNPVSLLTTATGDRMLDDALVRAFMSRCMVERRPSAAGRACRSMPTRKPGMP
jgi:2-dehydropantoate 2-reductase